MTQELAERLAQVFNEQWPVDTKVFWVATPNATYWSATEEPAKAFIIGNANPPDYCAAVKLKMADSPIRLSEIVVHNRHPETNND